MDEPTDEQQVDGAAGTRHGSAHVPRDVDFSYAQELKKRLTDDARGL